MKRKDYSLIERAQTSLFSEIFIDNFAGGGGASVGVELATGRPVDIAINHDPEAIAMHKANHPYTKHYRESVWNINPQEVCAGQKVALAWFSPDCKHFSKAKGGTPVKKEIRGLAWIVLRWAGTVRPRVIILENVEEFQTWGPVRKGKPVKSKKGDTFQKWKAQLAALGYAIEHRELRACDYGAPTIRKRFYLIARCDGWPITWPEPTHGDPKSEAVRNGSLLPWHTAAECIDFTLPCTSIFGRKKSLADNTMQRIARGLDKFVVKNPEPFIVQVNHNGGFRGQSVDRPLDTITAKHGYSVVAPVMTPIGYGEHSGQYTRAQDIDRPIGTIVAANKYFVTAAHLLEYYGNALDGISCNDPMHTITPRPREGVVESHLCILRNNMDCRDLREPLPTITAQAGHFAEVRTVITKISGDNDLQNWPKVRSLLNQYCGYTLTDDEILLFLIDGCWCFVSDIGLRMLTPRELYRAQGFPPDYIIEFDHNGKPYSKAAQVARCGNSVSPMVATALARANFPEYCVWDIATVAELLNRIAV